MKSIYSPAEDSYFFSEFLEEYLKKTKNKKQSYLDLGTGSGILSETASKFLKRENILAADINNSAVNLLKKKGFNAIKSNLFSKINQQFDLITFNAPYLPEDSREPKESRIATTGGKRGDEISAEFLKQARNHLNKNGKIFLLVSSLTPLEDIKSLGAKLVKRKKLWMEELLIFEIK
tara:strand:+ start:213 stop:743 length:531 start_codon:yes stop_codon:yes gene_type:complete